MKPHRRPARGRGVQRLCLVGVLLATGASLACNKSFPATPVAPTGSSVPAASATPVLPSAPTSPSGPTGTYTVTLTASPSCAVVTDSVSGQALPLPDSVRVRSYNGEFADGVGTLTALDGTGNRVPLGGIDHYAYPGQRLMFIQEGVLTIIVPPADGGGYIKSDPSCAGGDYWWEEFSNGPGGKEVFESCGTWRGSMQNPERIDGTISGSFGYYRGVGPHWTTDLFCTARDHHFTLTKR